MHTNAFAVRALHRESGNLAALPQTPSSITAEGFAVRGVKSPSPVGKSVYGFDFS